MLCGGETEILRSFPQSVTSDSTLIPAASALHLCVSCGHIQSTVDIDLRQYYAETYDSLLTDEGRDEIVSTADGKIVFRTDLDFALMKHHLGDRLSQSPAILEFGCGRGRILSRLHKEGHRRLVAHDVSELYREAVSPFVDRESVFIGERPVGTFDLVISFFVLEHDADPVGSLLYLRERVGEEGQLYLMLPNYLTNTIDLACADHVNHFSPQTLVALIEACGMNVSVVDATSAIGAMAVVAEPEGSPVERADMRLASAERVACARASSAEFLSYMARLEMLSKSLSSDRVALYGAGFYGTMVKAHFDAANLRVSDVFDANPRKQGASYLGLRVRSADELATGEWSDADLVMCVNPRIAAGVGERFAPYVRAVHVI